MKNLRRYFYACVLLTVSTLNAMGQTGVSINITGNAPDAQSMLDVTSTTKGALLPRMTSVQRDAIGVVNGQDKGLTIYNLTDGLYEYWDGVTWQHIPTVNSTGNTLDQAYDEGGPGAGRIIVASNGAVDIQGAGGLLVNGNVGIGTATPVRNLQIADPAGASLMLMHSGGGGTAQGTMLGQLLFESDDDSAPSSSDVDASAVIRGYVAEPSGHGNSNKGGDLAFLTKSNGTLSTAAATERMRITQNGNVGIGTSSPIGKLNIFAGGASGVAWSTGLNIGDATNYTGFIQDGGISRWRNFGTGGYDWYNSAASQLMSLSNSGLLSVGGSINSNTGYKVSGTATAGHYLRGNGSNFVSSAILPGDLPAIPSAGGWTDDGTVVRLTTATDKVGVGTTAPQSALDVITPANSYVSVGTAQMGVGQYAGIHFGYRESNTLYRKSAIVFERTDNSGGGANAAGKIHLLNGPSTGSGSATLADAKLTIGELGNVGIGTTAPEDKLHVSGNIRHTGGMVSRGATYTSTWMTFDQEQYGNSLILGSGGLTVLGAGESASTSRANLAPGDETLHLTSDGGIKLMTNMQSGWASRIEAMNIVSNGNVGIGTTAPTRKLDVNGQIRMRTGAAVGYVPVSSADGTMTWTSPTSLGADLTTASNGLNEIGNDIRLGGALTQPTEITQGTNSMAFNLTGTGDFDIQDNGTSALFVRDNGMVGIRMTTPNNPLDINGKLGLQRLNVPAGVTTLETTPQGFTTNAPSGYHALIVQENGTERMRVQQGNGYVGIGTSSPSMPLHVQKTTSENVAEFSTLFPGSTNGDASILIKNNNANSNATGEVYMRYQNNTMGGNSWMTGADDDEQYKIAYGADGEITNALTKMTILQNGNVGIGTTAPTAQLHTTGAMRFTNFANGFLKVDGSGNVGVGSGSGLFTAGNGLSWAGTTLNSVWTQNGSNIHNNNTANVGIGNTSPNAKLQVGSNHTATGPLVTLASQGTNYDALGTISTNEFTIQPYTYFHVLRGYAYTSGNQKFNTGDYMMTINNTDINFSPVGNSHFSTGNLGIGTTSPAQKLHVVGTARVSTLADASGAIVTSNSAGDLGKTSLTGNANHVLNGTGAFVDASTLSVTGDNLGNHTATTNLQMVNFNVNNANSVVIADPGDGEGILWAGTAAKIFVSPLNSGNADGYLRLINDGGIVFEPGAEDVEQVTFAANGKVGIGTTAPGARLDVYSATDAGIRYSGVRAHRPASFGQYAFMDYAYSSSAAYFGSVYTGSAGVYGSIHFRQYTQADVYRDAMNINTNGNVGIGTTNPLARLHVYNNGAIFGTNGSSSNTRTATLLESGDAQINFGSYPGAWTSALQIQNNDNSDFIWISPLQNGSNARFRTGGSGLDFYVGGANDTGTLSLSMNTAGNVGIGTASPAQKLHVAGTVRASTLSGTGIRSVYANASGDLTTTGPSSGVNGYWSRSGTTLSPTTASDNVSIAEGSSLYVGSFAKFSSNGSYMQYDGPRPFYVTDAVGITYLYSANTYLGSSTGDVTHLRGSNFDWNQGIIQGNGSVGIGTTAPGYNLEVNGNTSIGGKALVAGAGNEIWTQPQTNGSATLYVNYRGYADGTTQYRDLNISNGRAGNIAFFKGSTGNVGIGTTAPAAKFQVSAGNASYALFGPNSSWNAYLYVGAGPSTVSAGRAQVISTSGNLHLDAGTGQNIYIANYTGSNTFMQTGGGSVGIGTTGPTQKLDVNGRIRMRTGAATGYIPVSSADGTMTWTSPAAYTNTDSQTLSIGTTEYNLSISGGNTVQLRHLQVVDTRSANEPPTTFNNEVAFDFKARSAVGVPGSGTYSGIMTFAPWGDNSGNASHQLNFNEGGIYWRQGQPDAASWGSWYQLLTTANGISGGSGITNYLARWTSSTDLGTGTTYDNGTNVGVGTTAPAAKLDVQGPSGLRVGNGTYDANVVFGNNASWKSGIRVYDNGQAEMRIWTNQPTGEIVLTNGYNGDQSAVLPTDGLWVKSNKVGIGNFSSVLAPHKLTVDGNISTYNRQLIQARYTTSDSYAGSLWWDQLTLGNNGPNYIVAGRQTAGGSLRFVVNNTSTTYGSPNGITAMTMITNGNVGIGTTAPAYKLDVNGSLRVGESTSSGMTVQKFTSALTDVPGSTSGIQMVGPVNAHVVLDIRGNDGGDGFYVRVPTVLTTNPTVNKTAFVVKASGRAGIGTSAPTQTLDINGTLRIRGGTPGTGKVLVSAADGTASWSNGLPGGDASYIWNQTSTQASSNFHVSGIGYADASFRAPVFYDKDNTAYYANPASTSRFNRLDFNDGNTSLFEGAGNSIRHQTNYGYIDIGPQNSSWAHISTDRPRYYFNKGLTVDQGLIGSYSQNLQLQTSGTTRITVLNSNGNVGIGTIVPAGKLDIRWPSWTTTKALMVNETGDNPTIRIYRPTGNGSTAYPWHIGASGSSFQIATGGNAAIGSESVAAKFSIVSNGNVGIGTTAPDHKLQVNGSVHIPDGQSYWIGTGSDTGQRLRMHHTGTTSIIDYASGSLYFRHGTTTGVTMTNAGNLGIGTTGPAAKLDVNGQVKISGGSPGTGKVLTSNSVGLATWSTPSSVNNSVNVSTHWGYYVNTAIAPTGSIMLNVRVNGNNHIWNGTFLIQGSNSYTPNELWNNAKLISWQGYNASVNDVQALIMSNTATNSFGGTSIVLKSNAIGGGAAATMTITATGINSSSISPTTSAGAPYTYTMATSYNTYSIYQMNSGNVGIGITSPTYKLHVNGRLKTTGITETSDIRLKKNVKPIEDALENVLKMNGMTYDWRKEEYPDKGLSDGIQYGLIAQELEKVLPGLVLTDSEGWKSIEYTHLVPILIEAIKDQHAIINKLQDKEKSTEQRLQALEAALKMSGNGTDEPTESDPVK